MISTVYKSIDLIKFIMALFVVTIHCNITNSIDNELFNRICTSIIYSAVPFFYVTSAYLLFRHIKSKSQQEKRDFKSKFKKYYIHIAKMYIF
jgi:peptidoglycan/LPS O-acetylase OafA/YrhL